VRILGVTEDSRFLAGGRIAFIKLMKALAYAGNSVTILSSIGATLGVVDPQPARIIRINVTQARIVGPLLYLFKLFFHLPRQIPQAEIILVNSGYTVYIVALLGRLFRRKVIVLQHDVLGLEYLQSIASTTSRKYTSVLRWITIYTPLRIVDGVLCISDSTMRRLRGMGYSGPAYVVGNVVG